MRSLDRIFRRNKPNLKTLARTDSEEQARRAALAFMSNYEAKYGDATDKRLKKSTEEEIQKSLVELIKSKYSI